MTEKGKELIALFRYGLIAPLLTDTVSSHTAYLDEISAKNHDVPHYGMRTYNRKTLLEWHRLYRRHGFDALKPKVRTDKGSSRDLPAESAKLLLKLRNENIHLSVKLFHEWLIHEGHFTSSDCSYSTVYRLLKKHQLLKVSAIDTSDRRRFAHIDINTLWQTDVSHGPYLSLNGKKRKTYLIAFIDDASQRITGAQFMLAEKNEDLLHVLKSALLTCGKPTMLYADNGKIFRSHQLNTSCATLGIALVNAKPYDPKSKGKIERFFKTVRSRFYPLLTDTDLMDLDVLNQRFEAWLARDYHHKVHSSINEAPMVFYMRGSDRIKHFGDPRIIDEAFLIRVTRKVKKVMYFPMSSGTTMDFYRGLAFSLGEQPRFRKVELFYQIQNAITDLFDKRRITPVFILDEMQSASAQFLHDLSIIFNFDMDKRNPFILILTGLPTLANRLGLNQNRSLDQRLVTRFHFSPLTPDEVRDYIKHRFKPAGVSRNLINENAYEAISSSTGGYPRLVGNLVTQCLILAFQKQTDLIDEEIVFAASAEAGI